MTIRVKLTAWYAGILIAFAALIVGMCWHELHEKPDDSPEGDPENDLSEVMRVTVTFGIPIILISVGGGWLLMRKALAPITALTQAATKISESTLREQLPRTHNGDELDKLTEVFNSMTLRLDQSFQRVREFTLHASHELKTPLTVMHGEIETQLRDEHLIPEQREHLLSQLDEVQRLGKIVDGLTLLTKADAGAIPLNKKSVRLDELLREAHADAQILAQPQGIEVRLLACEEAVVEGDRHRLRQLLLNLTDNAVKYNRPGGLIELTLRRVNNMGELMVRNTSAGIPLNMLPRVFDRFFRVDPAHSSEVEGCGLGLSIAQWIVAAHGGTISLASELGKETVAAVRLPLLTGN